MTPVKLEFGIRNNEAWQDGFVLQYFGGAAFDFADFRPLRMHVKATADHPQVLIELTEDNGRLVVDVDGGLTIDCPPADVELLRGTYVHDIRGFDDGDAVVIAYGTVSIEQGATWPWPS